MDIGTNIKNVRALKGINQKSLAELSSIRRVYLSRIENNHITPRIPTLLKIAGALGVSIETLIHNHDKLSKNEVNNA